MTKDLNKEFLDLKNNLKNNVSFSNHNKLYNFVKENHANLSLQNGRVAVLSNYTFDTVLPLIFGEMSYYDLSPTSYVSDFDSIPENVFNPSGPLYEEEFDYFILSHWLESLSTVLSKKFLTSSPEEIEIEIERIVNYFSSIVSGIRKKSTGVILLNNFPLPEFTTLGILDIQNEMSHTNAIVKLNQEIASVASSYSGVYVVDYFSLFARLGFENCVDEKFWQMARAPIGKKALLPLAQEYGKFFRALTGKSKKCIVLDCDNTLWGGVIGEDGLSGIKLGNTHPGQSFSDLQQEILNLYNRGVLIALCSKNNEEDVLEVFEKHPDMLIKKEHVTTYQINWEDKATNIKRIATDLNIGLDSLVFIDDSPFECNLVKEQLPAVAVIELTKSAPLMKKQIQELAYFDSLAFSTEDKKRNEMYASDQNRKQLLSESNSLEEYLKGLDLAVTIAEVGTDEIPRASQLTQKTNQFNLTTKRYSVADIEKFVSSKDHDVLFMRLADKVSDLGIIGVAIIEYGDTQAHLDSLLMSCRALGRGAETAFLSSIVSKVKERKVNKLSGEYIKTAKNAQVADLYLKNGFKESEKISKHHIKYTFLLAEANITSPTWIKVN